MRLLYVSLRFKSQLHNIYLLRVVTFLGYLLYPHACAIYPKFNCMFPKSSPCVYLRRCLCFCLSSFCATEPAAFFTTPQEYNGVPFITSLTSQSTFHQLAGVTPPIHHNSYAIKLEIPLSKLPSAVTSLSSELCCTDTSSRSDHAPETINLNSQQFRASLETFQTNSGVQGGANMNIRANAHPSPLSNLLTQDLHRQQAKILPTDSVRA